MGIGRGGAAALGALVVTALATVTGAARGAGISVSIAAPTPRQGVALGSTLDVHFEVGSEALIVDTTVTVGGVSHSVSPDCTQPAAAQDCVVAVPLAGVPRGVATVSVRVETSLGEIGTATTSIVVDEAPTIGGLRNHGLVTTPSVTVTCTDLGAYPCRAIRLEERQPDFTFAPVASGTTSATWATASAAGASTRLRAVATDTAGIESTVEATILVDLTAGIARLSRVDGIISAVSDGYIVFEKLRDTVTGTPDRTAPHEVWLRDRATGMDTLLSANGRSGGTLAQGGYAEAADGSIAALWAGAKQSFPASAPWGIVRGSRYWIVAYPYGSKCFVRDMATSTETLLVDLQNVPDVTPVCQGAAIAPNGDYYVKAESTGGPNDTLVKIAGGATTVLPYGGFRKDWVAVDAANRVAYSKKRSSGATQIYLDGSQVGYGWEYAFRDGFLVYVQSAGGALTVRRPDGTEVPRQFFASQVFGDLGENGELGFSANLAGGTISHYLAGLTGAPTRVAGSEGNLSSVAGGWLLVQGDTLRCGRPPCGAVNPIPDEPVVGADGGAPTDAGAPADAGPTTPGADASAAEDASTGPGAGGESGCNAGGGTSVWFGIPAVAAVLLGRRRKRTAARG